MHADVVLRKLPPQGESVGKASLVRQISEERTGDRCIPTA